MPQPEHLSDLIGGIYDAALDPTLWRPALGRVAGYVGGPAATVFAKDALTKSGNIFHEYGIDPVYMRSYFDTYIKLDPSTNGQLFADIEQPIATADLIAYDEFIETRFYKEWARPQGLVDFVGAVLDRSAASFAMFGVFRHERDGLVDGGARQRMGLLIPHVRRAVLVGKVIDHHQSQAAALGDALDGLSAGAFLVDKLGTILHANATGQRMLAVGDVLQSTGGRLITSDPHADRSLQDMIARAAEGDAALGHRGIASPLVTRGAERYVLHLLPLGSGLRRRAGAPHNAVAALLVHKAALAHTSLAGTVAQAYGLTPTELRVLLSIVDVGGVPAVAESLGVAESTVKTHLGRLYQKTGARRHVDLAKLVARFSNPLMD